MAQTIKLKRSATQNAVPTTSQLALGEVALNTYDGKMYIKKSVGGTESIVEIGGDATSSSGLDFTGNLNLEDNVRIVIGDGNDLQIWHGGVDSYITNDSGHLQFIQKADDKDIQFYSDDGSGGTTQYMAIDGDEGRVVFNKWTRHVDGARILVGTGGDLAIYHDGSNSYIDDQGTGNLFVRADNLVLTDADGTQFLRGTANTDVKLYYANAIKFTTTSAGAQVSGKLFVSDTSNGVEIGASKARFKVNGDDTVIDAIPTGGGINFRTGGAVQAVKIDSDGRLLVNTTSSIDNLAKIQVLGDSSSLARITLKDVDGTNQYTYFEQSGGGTRINTQNGTSNGFFTIGGWNGTASSDFVRVTSAGRVGIGTTAPNYVLDVQSSVGGILARFKDTDSSHTGIVIAGDTNAGWVGNNSITTGEGIYYQNSLNAMRMYTNGSEAMRIDSSGRVGIGTTSPGEKLEVTGTIKQTGSYNLTLSGGANITGSNHLYIKGNNSYVRIDAPSNSIYYNAGTDHVFGNGDGSTEYMRIDTNGTNAGNVGIGTTSPSQKLDVEGLIRSGGIAHPEIELVPTGSVGNADIRFDGTSLDIRSNSSGAYLTLQTATTERLKITNTGNFEFNNGNFTEVGTISSGNITTSGYLAGPATFTIDPAAVGDNTGTVVIAGNLQVDGTTTTINSTTLTVDDKNITLASGSTNAAAANGAGITVDCGSDTDATFTYEATPDSFKSNKNFEIYTNGSLGQLSVGRTSDQAIRLYADDNYNKIFAYQDADSNTDHFFDLVRSFQGTGRADFRILNGSDVHMLIDKTGNVGIGTSSPASNLHISSTSTSTLTLQNTSNAGNASLHFRDESNNDQYKVLYDLPNNRAEQHFNGNGLRFYSNQISAEVAKIGFGNNYNTSYFAGRVGVGTNAPLYPLEVSGTGTVSIAYQRTGTGVTAKKWGFHSDNSNTYWQNITDNLLAITVSNAGNVGIGTTAPQSKIEVNLHSGATSSLMDANTVNDVQLIRAGYSSSAATTSNAGAKWGLRFVGRNDSNYDNQKSGAIYAVSEDSGAGYNRNVGLAFHTSGFDSNHAERMRITNTGNVAIGQTTAPQKLTVSGNITVTGTTGIQIATLSRVSDAGRFELRDSGGNTRVQINASGNSYFNASSSSFGIGTASPQRNLDVRYGLNIFGSGGYTELMLRGRAGTAQNLGAWHWSIRGDVGGSNDDLMLLRFTGGNSPSYAGTSMQIRNDNGYVGIGTNIGQATRQLHVKSSNYSVARLERDGAGGGVGLEFRNGDGNIWQIGNDGDEVLRFYYAGSNKFQITSSGAARFNSAFTFPTSDGSGNQVLQTDGSGNVSWASISGVGAPTYMEDADGDTKIQVEESADEDIIRFDTAGSQRMVIDSGGNFGFGVDTPSNYFHVKKNSAGIIARIEGTSGRYIYTGTDSGGHYLEQVGTSAAERIFRIQSSNGSSTYTVLSLDGHNQRIYTNSGTKVGIGTSSPDSKLTVNVTSNSDGIELQSSETKIATLSRTAVGGQVVASLDGVASRPIHVGGIVNEDVILANAGGNVGIGTTSPRHKLSVNGTLGSSTFSGFGLGVIGGMATAESATPNAAIGMQAASASSSKIFAYDYSGSAGIPISIQPDNADVYLSASGGNVGIGTTSPVAKLDVVGGHLRLDAGMSLQWDNSHERIEQSDGHLEFFVNNGEKMTLDTNGLGIGTTSPSAPLHVVGADSGIKISSAQGNRPHLSLVNGTSEKLRLSANNVYAAIGDSTDGQRYMTFVNGSIGIGTTSPVSGHKLTVNGKIGGLTYIDSYVQFTGGNAILKANDDVILGYTSSLYVKQSGKVGIGTSAPSNQFVVKNGTGVDMEFGSEPTAAFIQTYNRTSSAYGHLRFVTNGETMRLTNTGNVGIGTTSPASNLHVSSSSSTAVKITGDFPRLYFEDTAGSDLDAYIVNNANGLFFGKTNNPAGSNDIMALDLTNKRVGIGISSPTAALSVVDTSQTTTGQGLAGLRVHRPNATSQYGYVDYDHGGGGINVGSFYSGGGNSVYGTFMFRQHNAAGSQTPMAIGSTGNVGIGTTSPSNLLHIHATGNGSAALIVEDDARRLEMGRDMIQAKSADGSTVQNLYIQPAGVTSFASNSGSVGIGVTSPASKLHVKTSVDNSVLQGIIVERSLNSDRGYISYNGGAFQFRSTVGDPIAFGETDAEHMRILPDGNIGMGTTSPAKKLEIFGSGSENGILVKNDTNTNYRGYYISSVESDNTAYGKLHMEVNSGELNITAGYTGWGGFLTFDTNGAERMRIASNGDWSVSNTVANVASAYGNQAGCGWVDSDLHFEAATTSNRSAAEFGRNNANSGDVITIRQQGTSVGMIGTEGGDSLVIQSNGSTGTGIRFHPSRAAVEPVRAGVTIDDTISLGADTRRFKDLHLSNAANIGHASIETSSTSTTATTQVAIATFAAATFRSAEFTIQVTNSTDSTYHMTKVLLIHDGTTPGITEYGTIFTGSAAEATFDADISSGNVRLLATPASTDSMTFKVVRHCITV